MAISPKPVIQFVKKNIVPIFIGYGILKGLQWNYNVDYTYKYVYSKNDIERARILNQVSDHINNAKH